MSKKNVTISCILLLSVVLFGFAGDNYFVITDQDVVLKIPKGFPKPVYKFRGNKLTPEIFTLGRKLFYDPILSKDSTISCAFCHQRIAAFGHMDHPLSHGINGLKGNRNVPPLQNLIWKDAFMWDGGVNHLVEQPLKPLTNPVEMAETMEGIITKLGNNSAYREDFKNAFGDTIISSESILKSLAQFTGLMISSDSRYDRYVNGTDTFSASEKNGLQLFRQKCATCHKEPLFTDNSYRNNGIAPDTALNDKGRALVTNQAADNYKFKVPSLRNIERSYPYMHDGRFRKLSEVIDHYANPENFAANADPALRKIGKLSYTDKKDLISFLNTLTDKTFLYDRRFVDPFMK